MWVILEFKPPIFLKQFDNYSFNRSTSLQRSNKNGPGSIEANY